MWAKWIGQGLAIGLVVGGTCAWIIYWVNTAMDEVEKRRKEKK